MVKVMQMAEVTEKTEVKIGQNFQLVKSHFLEKIPC